MPPDTFTVFRACRGNKCTGERKINRFETGTRPTSKHKAVNLMKHKVMLANLATPCPDFNLNLYTVIHHGFKFIHVKGRA